MKDFEKKFNVVFFGNQDFDYAQSDSHPERSRRVFEILFLLLISKTTFQKKNQIISFKIKKIRNSGM